MPRKERKGAAEKPLIVVAVGAALLALNLGFYRGALTEAFFGNDLVMLFTATDLPGPLAAFSLDVNCRLHEAFGSWFYRPGHLLLTRALAGLFGTGFLGWHASLLAVHLVNVALVFALSLRYLGGVRMAFAAAGLWSIGWYKADAVMWMTSVHAWLALPLLLALVIGNRAGGALLRLALIVAAALMNEIAWVFAVVLLLEGLLVRKARPRENRVFAAGLAAAAAAFGAVYWRIAVLSPVAMPGSGPIAALGNLPAIAASLAIPFNLMFNKLNALLAARGLPPAGWVTILVPFWLAVLAAALWLWRAAPRLAGRLARDRVFIWTAAWSLVCLLPEATQGAWLNGRRVYFLTAGLAIALGRFAADWATAAPRFRRAIAALALAFMAVQLGFAFKVRAHMDRGHREIPALVESIRTREAPPRPGEVWVIARYPYFKDELGAFVRFAHGRRVEVRAFPGEASQLPEGNYRLFEYDRVAVTLTKVREVP